MDDVCYLGSQPHFKHSRLRVCKMLSLCVSLCFVRPVCPESTLGYLLGQ